MSSDTPQSSPSLLTYLRQYRFQRKPNASESTSSSNSQPTQTASTMRPSPLVNLPPGITYKRIRVMRDSSESDSGSPPQKKPQTDAASGVNIPSLAPAVKERRFKNMSEMFPEISASTIKNALIKHNWNEERCRDELLDDDPECEERMVYVKLPGSSGNTVGPNYSTPPIKYYNQNGRTAGTSNSTKVITVVASPMEMKKKSSGSKGGRRRRGSVDSDDSDYANRKGRDDKVYDSSDDDSDAEIDTNLVGEKKNVYEFLNSSKRNELVMLSGCSAKKADVIIGLRPFNGWLDMVQKFQESKFLNTDILNSTQELLSMRNNVQKLMKKCMGLAAQLEAAVAVGGGVQKQPNILTPSLRLAPYQLIGLNWLIVLHQQGVSGILADEMGLGKTVQVIAFLAHLKETNKAKGPHLVVVPASTLDNWSNEFARWCPSMNVSMYYGPQDERRMLRIKYVKGGFQDLDVILTTYSMLGSLPEERKMFRVMPLDYVAFDEAHMLKNMATQRYENLIKIQSRHRILLTGTPLQNNLLELMSLLCFVMPHMFEGNTDDLKSLFQKNSKNTSKKKKDESKEEEDVPLFEQSQISQAKRIMKPFLLRRLKRDVLKDLPKKTDVVLKVPMTDSQQLRYTDLIKSFSANGGFVHANNEQSGMSMMMDMRKLANHPLLMRYYYDEDKLHELAARLADDTFYKETNPDYIFQDLLFMSDFHIHQMTSTYKSIVGMKIPDSLILESGKFAKLDEMLPRLQQEDHRVLIFSQFTIMLDILEPYLRLRNHRYLRLDGSTAVTERQNLIDEFNEDESIFVFLLSTKAGGLGINLTAADTVIIHDIDFNPYNDKQAEDRCHRMGQKRPVSIYRLLSIGTIEEGIFQVAQEKLSLERDITKTDENESHESKNVVRLLTLALGLTSSNK